MVSVSQVYAHPVRRSGLAKPNGVSRYYGIIVLALLAMLYIAQATQTSTKSVEVQGLHEKIGDLTNSVDQLQLESARAQTLDMISTEASPLALQPVDSVEYLNK